MVNKTSSRSAGEVLQALVNGPGLPDVPVPACLNQCINQEVFSCKICQEPYDNIHALVSHGAHHLSDPAASLTCAFCGVGGWPSLPALSLHQLVWQRPGSRLCPDCGAGLEVREQRHDCHLAGGTREREGRFRCPLQCSQVYYPLEYLKAHLVSFHGCEACNIEVVREQTGQVEGMKAELGKEAVSCPHCFTKINQQAIRLEHHLLLSCSARSPSVTEKVSSLACLAEEAGQEPLLVVRQEIEALVLHLASLLERGSYLADFLQTGQTQDLRYPSLPSNFSRDMLAWLPPGCTQQTLAADKDNLLVTFGLWSQVVERLSGPPGLQSCLARLETQVGKEAGGKVGDWPSLDTDPTLDTQLPDPSVLSALETQLGWGATPTLAVSNYSKFNINRYCDSIGGDCINTTSQNSDLV